MNESVRNICVNLISILSFNLAYCQSRIISNGQSNNFSVPLYNQTQTPDLSKLGQQVNIS